MAGYANLQLILGSRTEAARERIMYVITAYMDAQGLMPCGRDSAERTVRFARGEDGVWAVFDDEADRMDIRALDGLGRCLTGKLHAKAVGMMGTERGRMLRLYVDGRLRDTYLPFPGENPSGKGGFGRFAAGAAPSAGGRFCGKAARCGSWLMFLRGETGIWRSCGSSL